jgi:hypothetical protein
MTPEDSKAKVVTDINMTESFNINVAVRQGNALPVTMFNLALDYIIKKSDIRGNI